MTRAMHRILIIEDDADIRNVLRTLLEQHQYRVVEASTAARGGIEARAHKPDLLLVDLGLPDADGVTVIRGVRTWSTVPILVLSARMQEDQKIAALDAGADDYVTKPFSTPELLARVRAALRRNVRTPEQSQALKFGGAMVNLATREARHESGESLHLTPLEHRLLETLARRAGLVVKQDLLLKEVWGPGRVHDTRSLRACIKNLRQKLEPDPARPRYLLTETGIGYRLRQEEAG